MKLERESWLVRWAYVAFPPFGSAWEVPRRASLCEFFWRVVLTAPLLVALMSVILVLASPVLLLVWLWGFLPKPAVRRPAVVDVVGEYLQAKKARVCPIIEFKG